MLVGVCVGNALDLTIDLHFLPQLCLAPFGPQTVVADTACHLASVDETTGARIVCHTGRLRWVFGRGGL